MPDKDAILTELRAVRRAAKEPLTKAIVENTIDKLLEVPEPECSHFIAGVKACFKGENGQPSPDRLTEAGIQEPPLLGHDLFGMERSLPSTAHGCTGHLKLQQLCGRKSRPWRACGKSPRSWKRSSPTRAGKRRITSYEHSKTAVQKNSPYGGLCFHFPNKSLCVPVRASVSTSTSSSMR